MRRACYFQEGPSHNRGSVNDTTPDLLLNENLLTWIQEKSNGTRHKVMVIRIICIVSIDSTQNISWKFSNKKAAIVPFTGVQVNNDVVRPPRPGGTVNNPVDGLYLLTKMYVLMTRLH